MDLVLPTAIGGLGVACLLIAILAGVWRWRRQSRRCCPGPRRSWRAWLTGRWIVYRERCDEQVSIPMRGRVASLNVGTAGTLACFEIARARRQR